MHRAALAAVLSAWLVGACLAGEPADEAGGPQTPTAADAEVPAAELNPAADPQAVLDSARSLMRADSNTALVTVDSAGQPRIRTVRAFVDAADPARPNGPVTVWIMTRLSTRKIDQIRRHPRVTLYFNDDDRVSYATLMGTATVHTDPEHPGARRHYDREYAEFFWPNFPADFVMIEVRARWLEYMGPGLWNDPGNWRPQAVVLEP